MGAGGASGVSWGCREWQRKGNIQEGGGGTGQEEEEDVALSE